MVYAHHLREAGDRFMRDRLAYSHETGDGRNPLTNGGGNYLALHMRRY